MKHVPTGTLHSYEPAWLVGDNHGFVECDEHGNFINAPIEGEATRVVEATQTPKKSHHKTKHKVVTAAEEAVEEAIKAADTALSADASANL